MPTEPDRPEQPEESRPIPDELRSLRDEIDGLDRRLLEILAERRRRVARVADVKREHAIRVRDRAREHEILADRIARCEALGLPPDQVESLYRLLLARSRDHQAALGTELPAELPRRRIAIIGGGGAMGSAFARLFTELGNEVIVSDLDQGPDPVTAARESEVVMVSVPIDVTDEVIRSVGPACRPDALLLDLTSTKSGPMQAMLESSACSVIGTHPMFGPGVNTLQEQRIVLVPGRSVPGTDWDAWLRTCLRARGLRILDATAEEHDRAMAIVQVLTHFSTEVLGLAMSELTVPVEETLRFASPVYLIELLMTARHFQQDGALYGAIHAANPNRHAVVEALERSLERWKRAVESDDPGGFEALFSECREFFGAFGGEAMAQSAHLIDRLVERG